MVYNQARAYVQGGSKEPKAGGDGGDGAIHSFTMADDGKAFTSIEVVQQGGTFPMFLACDESKQFVYAAETPAGDTDAPGFINAYSLSEDGKLTLLNRVGSVRACAPACVPACLRACV